MNHLKTFVLEELGKEQEPEKIKLKHLKHEYDVEDKEWDAFVDFIQVELEGEFELKEADNERGSYRELYNSKNERIARYYTSDDTLEATFNWDILKKIIDGDLKEAKKIFK